MFETYSTKIELDHNDFREVAEKYFQNYLSAWCERNHVDDTSRETMIKVLSDYSNFLFDSLMHSSMEGDAFQSDLKN